MLNHVEFMLKHVENIWIVSGAESCGQPPVVCLVDDWARKMFAMLGKEMFFSGDCLYLALPTIGWNLSFNSFVLICQLEGMIFADPSCIQAPSFYRLAVFLPDILLFLIRLAVKRTFHFHFGLDTQNLWTTDLSIFFKRNITPTWFCDCCFSSN